MSRALGTRSARKLQRMAAMAMAAHVVPRVAPDVIERSGGERDDVEGSPQVVA